MSNPQKMPEPSMDDIINSIRSIIADDSKDNAAPGEEAPAREETAPAPEGMAQQTADQTSAKPVVQLSENQISEPIAVDAPTAVPVAETVAAPRPEPVAAPSLATPPAPAPTEKLAATPASMQAMLGEIEKSNPAPSPLADDPVAAAPPLQAALAPETVHQPGQGAVGSQANIEAGLQQMLAPETPPVPAQPVDLASAGAPAEQTDMPQAPSISNPVPENAMPESAMPESGMPDELMSEVNSPLAAMPAPAMEAAVVADDGAAGSTAKDLDAAAAATAVAAATSEAVADSSKADMPASGNCGRTLEDSVREMLKPMIREWLDDNMPRILEGAIKEDVDKPKNS